ncbi:uncharacterized protein Bfra_002829 [Botrytis fragariae]|uniref:DUF7371 domain-containing protein n=1 Tax=Botrytis fragariae TaxID=1964551 RepID=A0A8H6AZP2_9HELO|nr:uncharacterized protein Bfra_002829 [Botrytis fragariae]KAF5876425.1 hypothetical protein Bfra_002829 [Botrytis fragariae]
MIFNFLIAIWVICGAAGAAPQYGPIESTVTVYASCSETPAPFPTAIASNRMAQISADSSLPLYVAPTVSAFSSVGSSKSTWTIEASQSSKLTGSLETAAEGRQIPQSFSDVFFFIVDKGTTSWLNGQTPTSAPSQSFVVITSAITVVPLSIPPPPASTSASSSEIVVISTATVIPLPTTPSPIPSSPYSSTKSSISESVIISTATVIPLSTLPSPQSSSMITKTKTLSTSKPVVMSTVTTTPVSSTSSSSSSTTSQLASSSNMVITLTTTKTTVVPFSTLLSTATASSKPTSTSTGAIVSSQSSTNYAFYNATIVSGTSTFASVALQNAVVSTSTISFNLSSMASNLSTTANPLSSLSSVSSLTISRPEVSESSIKPVTSTSSIILASGVEFSTLLTANSSFKSASPFATHTVFTPISAVSQSASGRIFTGVASKPSGWNSTSQTASESSFNTHTSAKTGSLTTLTAPGRSQAATQISIPAFATVTISDSSFSMPTSTSSLISLSKDTPSSTYTSSSSSTSTSVSTSIPSFNATSYASSLSKSTSSSILTLISNATSTSQSIPSSTDASISSFISVIKGPSSVTFPNSTSSTSPIIISSATPTNCGERGDFVLTFDDVPPLSVSNASGTDVQPEPLFNPYHQFLFSDGFTVVPPPKRLPILPSSKPLLLEFIPNFVANSSNRQTGPNSADHGFSGQIGSGDEGLTGCFNFNLYGASLGCDSTGPTCDFTFTGYKYDVVSKKTSQVMQQVVNVPACPELSSCVLTTVDLEPSFMDLTYFFMNVTVAGKPKLWWMDDLRLGWSDNSCAMGFCRQNAHVR